MKLVPLAVASIKGFLRNWRSVALLLGVPLLLVATIVVSFNPDGVQDVPAGVVEQNVFSLYEYEDSYLSFLELTPYQTLEECRSALRRYEEYVCLDVNNRGERLDVHVDYDNTREPIIWEILQRIERGVESLQSQQSEQRVSELLQGATGMSQDIQDFRAGLADAQEDIATYSFSLRQATQDTQQASDDLSLTLAELDRDLDDLEVQHQQMNSERLEFYTQASLSLNLLEDQLDQLPSNSTAQARARLHEARAELNAYNEDMIEQLDEVDARITSYRAAQQRGQQFSQDIDDATVRLEQARADLERQQTAMQSYDRELASIQNDLGSVESLNAENLLNPIVLASNPLFIPDFDIDESQVPEDTAQAVNKAVSLISLQTLFPTILLLILLFLSLLISSFLCLREINSPASVRVRLIPGVFEQELLATATSSLIITLIPVLCVLVAGDLLFQLDIFGAWGIILPLVLVLAVTFVFTGMSIAYVVRKESTALLLTTFLLVFFMFFSGFLVPIERMSPFFSSLAGMLPPQIGLEAFNKAVFYGQPFGVVATDFYLLGAWAAVLFVIVSFSKATSSLHS